MGGRNLEPQLQPEQTTDVVFRSQFVDKLWLYTPSRSAFDFALPSVVQDADLFDCQAMTGDLLSRVDSKLGKV